MPHFDSDPLEPLALDEWRGCADQADSPFVDDFGCSPQGVAIDSLPPGTALDVTTRNTRYRLIVMDPDGDALVLGGSRFPAPTKVRIEGSTAGGRALKLGWIGVGLRLELSIGPRTITTSPVRSVEHVAA